MQPLHRLGAAAFNNKNANHRPESAATFCVRQSGLSRCLPDSPRLAGCKGLRGKVLGCNPRETGGRPAGLKVRIPLARRRECPPPLRPWCWPQKRIVAYFAYGVCWLALVQNVAASGLEIRIPEQRSNCFTRRISAEIIASGTWHTQLPFKDCRAEGMYISFVGILFFPSSLPSPEGRGPPLQPKGVGLPGITRKRVGFPLQILD